MNIFVFLGLLFGIQFLCFLAGEISSKVMKGRDDYFLAGKALRFLPLMMTCVATQVGGGLVLGAAEEAYHYGWPVLFYPLGASLGLLVLGLGVGQRLAALNVPTVAQIFEKFYGSSFLKKIASLLSMITLFMVLIAQYIASHKFMVALGIDSKLIFIAFWAIVISYTALGGLKAVVATDAVQATFFIGTFALALVWVLVYGDVSHLPTLSSNLAGEADALDIGKILGWLLMPLFFILIEQDMAQRCFAADAPKTIKRAAVWSGACVLLVCMIPVYFGIVASHYHIVAEPGASILMKTIEELTNPWLTAIVGCAIICAIISTADSLMNAISSNLNQDFKLSFLGQNEVRNAQIITMTISALGIFCSFYFNAVVDVLIQSYELSISCLFISIMFALFKNKGYVLSAALSIAFGAFGFIFFRVIAIEFLREIYSIGFSLTGYLLGEVLMARRTKPILQKELS